MLAKKLSVFVISQITTLFASTQRTSGLSISNLISASESFDINRINSNIKVGRAKSKAKYFCRKYKKMAESKILILSNNFLLSL